MDEGLIPLMFFLLLQLLRVVLCAGWLAVGGGGPAPACVRAHGRAYVFVYSQPHSNLRSPAGVQRRRVLRNAAQVHTKSRAELGPRKELQLPVILRRLDRLQQPHVRLHL